MHVLQTYYTHFNLETLAWMNISMIKTGNLPLTKCSKSTFVYACKRDIFCRENAFAMVTTNEFRVNRVLMKLFKSSNIVRKINSYITYSYISNIVVIEQCRYFFHIELPSVQLQRRFEKFLANAANDDNVC